jgi:hypothetical protein
VISEHVFPQADISTLNTYFEVILIKSKELKDRHIYVMCEVSTVNWALTRGDAFMLTVATQLIF